MEDFVVQGSEEGEFWVPSSQPKQIRQPSDAHTNTVNVNRNPDSSLIDSFTTSCQSLHPSLSISSFPSTKILVRDTSTITEEVSSISSASASVRESEAFQGVAPVARPRPRPRPKTKLVLADLGSNAPIEAPKVINSNVALLLSKPSTTPITSALDGNDGFPSSIVDSHSPPTLDKAKSGPIPGPQGKKRRMVIDISDDETPRASTSKVVSKAVSEKPKKKKKKADEPAEARARNDTERQSRDAQRQAGDDTDELDILGLPGGPRVSAGSVALPSPKKKKPKKTRKDASPVEKEVEIQPPSKRVATGSPDSEIRNAPEKIGPRAKENNGTKGSTLETTKATSTHENEKSCSPGTPSRVLKPIVEIQRNKQALEVKKIDSPAADPHRGYRVPARTKTPMSELLMKVQRRPSSSSPSALKISKSSLSRIAPLHPNRRTPPPPPPRVVRQEKKTKAQQLAEELWEEEWEEQYGEAWYDMSEEDKERLRRERRAALWVED